MARYDSKYFEKQFEGLPPKAVAIIALRAAMRVFPVLAQRNARGAVFWFWPAGDRVRHTHVVCRCFQSSAFVNSLTKDAARAARAATADAARAATAADAYAAAAAACADAAAATADATADAADAAARAAAYAAAAYAAAYAADAARAANAAAYAIAAAYGEAADAAIFTDIAQIQRPSWIVQRPSWIDRLPRREDAEGDPVFLLAQPLWPEDVPAEAARLWIQLQRDLRGLDSGFEVWIDWYQDRLDGKSFDWEIERQWALLSEEQLSQSPAEINAYLKGLRGGVLTKELSCPEIL
jgi:hypothetical protein